MSKLNVIVNCTVYLFLLSWVSAYPDRLYILHSLKRKTIKEKYSVEEVFQDLTDLVSFICAL